MFAGEQQQAFYSGGDPDYNNNNNSAPYHQNSQIHEFRDAFKHFLLHFSLSGQNIYKEKIRRLDLLRCNRYGNTQSGQDFRATSHSVPSLLLDLEHCSMNHWVPSLGQLGNNSQSDHPFMIMEDSVSQVSEEAPTNNTSARWGEILVQGFRQQPLRFIGVAEDVVRDVYLELLTAAEKEVFVSNSDFSSDESSAMMNEDNSNNNNNNNNNNLLSVNDATLRMHLGLFQLELISRTNPRKIRDLGASSVETLVVLSGIVIQAYKPQHKAIRIKIRCQQCSQTMVLKIPLWRESIELPRTCASQNSNTHTMGETSAPCPIDPYKILSDESEYCDVQNIRMQELPEHVPTGDIPRNITLNAANALCGRVVPGERVFVVGVYSAFGKGRGAGNSDADPVRSSYVHVVGLDYSESTGSRKQRTWKYSEEEQFQSMARDPQIKEKIFRSIAPSLIGLEDIKKSIACLLFGGSRKCLTDGTRLRGDINILLLGDPSTAKSQFLKFVEKAAPIAVYTSGKGSSAAGLTAAVIRDTNGNYALEGGAMVLADGGVVCIDEFDKMRDNDRVAIHEAMEQQTISIAKAGITTVLTTRTSVLAAANPSFGSYDDSKDTIEQHDFESTILSRFDLIWLVRDEKSVERDKVIARHIYDLHCGGGQTAEAEAPIPLQTLKDYIAYCRSVCNPILAEDAAKKLENFYVEVRESVRLDSRKRRDQIPITIRQLESLARLSEGLAKMELSRVVAGPHVEEAIRLFKLATVEAAKSTLARENLTEAERERIKAAETVILSHLPLNGRSSKSSVLRELSKRGFDPAYTARALKTLIQKGFLEERGDSTLRRQAGI